MNPIDQAIADIQQWIIQNGNEEITANVLRPILIKLAKKTIEVTGNPVELQTVATNLVAAINEINSRIPYGGIKIITGSNDPNITEPASYNLGDFYVRYSGASLIGFYQYNGIEWIPIPNKLKGYTVDTLPEGIEGDTAYVTDADKPSYLGVAIGEGGVTCKVFFNGTNWIT